MITAEIMLNKNRLTGSLPIECIVEKCRKCKSRVLISMGDFCDVNGCIFEDVQNLEFIKDHCIKITTEGSDELTTMCKLVEYFRNSSKAI